MDTACALTFVAHGFYGIEAMIGDYVPLIAPLAVAKVSYFHQITLRHMQLYAEGVRF